MSPMTKGVHDAIVRGLKVAQNQGLIHYSTRDDGSDDLFTADRILTILRGEGYLATQQGAGSVKIVITLDVPDGTRVTPEVIRAEYAHATEPAEPIYTPAFADELIPLPAEALPIPGDVNLPPGYAQGAQIAQPVPPFRGAATNAVPDELCSVHRVPWKAVPAGVSKKTGKPYSAFWGCSSPGQCSQRPSGQFIATHPL